MLSKSQTDKAVTTAIVERNVGEPSIAPKEFQLFGIAPSAYIALLAFILSGLSYRNSKKTSRQSRFDSEYGDEMSTELRKLEKIIRKFRGFEIKNNRSLVEKKVEILDLQVELEESILNVSDLANEMNFAHRSVSGGWDKTIISKAKTCLESVEATTSDDVTTDGEFLVKVKLIEGQFKSLVSFVREKTRELRKDL